MRKSESMVHTTSFLDRKRSQSKEKVIGDYEFGSHKYCESCKYRVWKRKMMTYDPIELVNNRDLIKSVKCLA